MMDADKPSVSVNAVPAATQSTGIVGDVVVTDVRGRKITLRRPSFLDEFNVVEAVGPKLASNQAWMGMLNPLLFVVAIDGDLVEPITSALQAKALISQVGRDGNIAVMLGIRDHFKEQNAQLEAQIKNLLGTAD